MNQEKPDFQKYESLGSNEKDKSILPPEKPIINDSSLEPGREKRIEEIRQNLDKAFRPEQPEQFDELLVIQKLEEASNIIYDMDDLPLSANLSYKTISEWLTAQCEKAVSVFLKKAREGNVGEKLRYSTALMRLGMVADGKAFDDALKHNLTNRHAIEELYKKSREENRRPDERNLSTKEGLKIAGKILLDGIKSLFKRK